MIHQIKFRYDRLCQTPSSINELLPHLKELASSCETVVELGVDIGQSTTAFLLAQPLGLFSVDMVRRPELDELTEASLSVFGHSGGFDAQIARTRWVFHLADTRTCSIPPCELLFIDTTHTYDHLKAELERHAGQASQYLILHDTLSFGQQGEVPGERGIMPAIEEYLAAHPYWRIREHIQTNNGLMILERGR